MLLMQLKLYMIDSNSEDSDRLVYQLYSLTEVEIKIVEGET